MKNKKSLQKFIETETKINQLLTLQQITPSDLEPLRFEITALYYHDFYLLLYTYALMFNQDLWEKVN